MDQFYEVYATYIIVFVCLYNQPQGNLDITTTNMSQLDKSLIGYLARKVPPQKTNMLVTN